MRIAVPVLDDVFCEHFGRSNGFFLCDVEEPTPRIGRTRTIRRPTGKGKCESLPDWLKQMGITHILTGGIGEVGRHRFEQIGITISVGHSGRDPLEVLMEFLANPPAPVKNPCADFEHRHRHCRGGASRKFMHKTAFAWRPGP